jgi:hypothetical protein
VGSMRRSRNRNATRADARYQMPDADRPNHTKTTKDYTLSSHLNHSSLNHSHLNHLIILHTVSDLPASCCCWQCITPSSSKCIAISSQSPSHDHMDDFAFSINIASRPCPWESFNREQSRAQSQIALLILDDVSAQCERAS